MPITSEDTRANIWADIAATIFLMGSEDGPHPQDGEGPVREISLVAFSIAKTTVTNSEFSAFVAQTGYKTHAERVGGSFVFAGQLQNPDQFETPVPQTPWWRFVPGAAWKSPTEPGRIYDPHLPTVHIALQDARAYAAWQGARLPTEAEWECAARGGLEQKPFPNGNTSDGEASDGLNIWKGGFPDTPVAPPGPLPASSGLANAFGLHHPCGNVWEWCSDHFTPLHSPRPQPNPKGPLNGSTHVVKGGSFLCCPSYCARFRTSSRRGENPLFTASNLGFRLAKS